MKNTLYAMIAALSVGISIPFLFSSILVMVIAAIVIILGMFVWSCCKVASDADDKMDQMLSDLKGETIEDFDKRKETEERKKWGREFDEHTAMGRADIGPLRKVV